MSCQNVQLVERGIDAFNRRDAGSFAELATSDFEWFPALPGRLEGESGGYHGRAGIAAYLGDVGDTWQELRVIGDEIRDLGDRVLVLGRTEGRGTGSGAPVDAPLGFLVEFRAGHMSRVRTYFDHSQALQAAGLSA